MRVLGCVELEASGLDLTQIKLPRALWGDHLLEGHHLIPEELVRQLVQAVTHIGVEEIVGDHGVEERPLDLHTIRTEYLQVVLEVLPHLEGARLLEDRGKLA